MSLGAVSLRDLEYVVAIAEQGSFVGAAEHCGVSQPSLSAQVRKVEGWIKTPLFERTTRKVLLTDSGRRFVEQARRVLTEARLLPTVVDPDAAPFGGTLRLSAIATLGPYFFPRVLRRLRQRYEGLSIILGEGLTDPLVTSLRNGDLDAVLMSTPVEDALLDHSEIFSEPFFLACPEDTHLTGSAEEAWSQLPSDQRLLLEEGHCLRVQAMAVCTDAGKRDRHGTSLETLKYMVATGEGCTLVPALAATDVEGVRYMPASPGGFARTIVLAWRRSDVRSEQFQTLAGELRHLAETRAPGIRGMPIRQ